MADEKSTLLAMPPTTGRRTHQRHRRCSGWWSVLAACAALLLGIAVSMLWLGYPQASKYWRGWKDAALRRSLSPVEQEFLQAVEGPRSQAKQWLHYFTSQPHMAGTEQDRTQAQWMLEKWTEFGLPHVWMDTYYPLLNYPRDRKLAIVAPPEKRYECSLREDPVEDDDTSVRFRDAIPAFHGYSADGDVTGPLVYVNYGRLEDFELLHRKGVELNGTIALVKYGKNFRGLKVRAAELYGCIGVIVYSDPKEDGYAKGKTYPDGPWRPESSFQRGSVFVEAGDPSTPGYPAYQNATRVPREESESLPKIPSLPLSYRDAKPLLESLRGFGLNMTGADFGWTGALDVEYWTGPGDAMVRLMNRVDYRVTPIWNVMAKIPGTLVDDQPVILGNHRDAWGMGAVDPASGTACLMEIARALGGLVKRGWKPKRSIILASWDGEEYGMVGSVEYVEEHRKWLRKSALAYLNVDTAVSGPIFRADATPSLAGMIREVTKHLRDPYTQKTLYESWLQSQVESGWTIDQGVAVVGDLGSGSDFIGFVDHAGVAAINFHFNGDYGVYHSNYDSFTWMTKYGDPTFEYHVTASQLWGLMALKLADEENVLPFNYTEYGYQLKQYVLQLEKKMPYGRLEWLMQSAQAMESSFRNLRNRCWSKRGAWSRCDANTLNRIFLDAERLFLDEKGIPGRPWYKHIVYAPGVWSGYGADTFPTLSEAIDKAKHHRIPWTYVLNVERQVSERIMKIAQLFEGVEFGKE